MSSSITVLVIDDEPAIRRLLRTSLAAQGYRIVEAADGTEALAAVARDKPDLLILDLGLPDVSGIDIIRDVRRNSTVPIIVLSVREDERGKVEALDLGADDYITKPFGTDELVARIRTALRHRFQEQGEKPLYVSGDLTVDLVRRIVKRGGTDVHLSPKEYDLLAELVANAGKVLTHRHILNKVWGPAHVEDAPYLRVFIRNLRNKLEADPARPTHITTEPGVGYRLRPPEDEKPR
jgi:two-component system KDP operon response regulator KdpE